MERVFESELAVSKITPFLPPSPPPLENAPVTNRFSLALLSAAILLGGAIKLCGPAWAQSIFHAVTLDNLGGLSALLAALAASVVLHEAGHLVAALLLDFETVGICIGPVRATRSYGKWSVHGSSKLFTGSVSAIPRSVEHWRERVLVVVAAGPFATLITGMLAALLFFSIPGSGWSSQFLAGLAQLNLLLFVLGFIPNSANAPVRNDARLFLILWADSSEAREIFLHHLVTRLELNGVRPRDYPLALIRVMAGMQSRPNAMLVYSHLVVLWALDRGDSATALAWDERALELAKHSGAASQEATLARSVCLDVLLRNDLLAAKRKLTGCDLDSLLPAWVRHRGKATHALVNGNIPEALAEISSAQQAFPARLPYFEFERMLLGRLHRKVLDAARPKDLSIRHLVRAA